MADLELPSTAEEIKKFLNSPASSAVGATNPTYRLKKSSNLEVLEQMIPRAIEFARHEAQNDIENYGEMRGTVVTSYGNVRDAIPLPETMERLAESVESLKRVARTRRFSEKDVENIQALDEHLSAVKVFFEAHAGDIKKHQGIIETKNERLRAEDEAYVPKDDMEKIDKDFGCGPNSLERAELDGSIDCTKIEASRDYAAICVINDLQDGFERIVKGMADEIERAGKRSR